VNVVYNICKELAKEGHEVSVYTTNAFDEKRNFKLERQEYTCHGFKVRYFQNVLRPDKLYISPSMVSACKKEITNFDIIHLHAYRQFQEIITYHYAKKHHVPYVLHLHGTLPWRTAKKELKLIYNMLFGYRILRDASKVFALSPIEAQQCREYGLPHEKIEVVPNGVELLEFRDLPPRGSFRRKYNINDDDEIILYLGRVDEQKGLDFLIRAFAYLTKQMNFNSVSLLIAGPGNRYLHKLMSLVDSCSISKKVIFTGSLSEESKVQALVDSSIIVYPERFNVFGLVPLEAAACSKPVVVSRENYMSKIVEDGGFGFSINYGDIVALGESMKKLIENQRLSASMGAKGRQFVFKNFGWENISRKIESVYFSVANK